MMMSRQIDSVTFLDDVTCRIQRGKNEEREKGKERKTKKKKKDRDRHSNYLYYNVNDSKTSQSCICDEIRADASKTLTVWRFIIKLSEMRSISRFFKIVFPFVWCVIDRCLSVLPRHIIWQVRVRESSIRDWCVLPVRGRTMIKRCRYHHDTYIDFSSENVARVRDKDFKYEILRIEDTNKRCSTSR